MDRIGAREQLIVNRREIFEQVTREAEESVRRMRETVVEEAPRVPDYSDVGLLTLLEP